MQLHLDRHMIVSLAFFSTYFLPAVLPMIPILFSCVFYGEVVREEQNMAKLTRRGFLGKSSIGVATVGALLTAPGLAEITKAASGPEHNLTQEELAGPIVAHVRNLSTGEIAIMVGTREIVFHDRQFVKRLSKAVR